MPADPQEPKDGRIAVWPCGHGNVYWDPGAAITGLACAQCGARATTYVPASVVDALREERDLLRDALREIADVLNQHGHYVAYHKIAGIVANGPLATAPGGDREDECFRLREERDALRAELEELREEFESTSGLYVAADAEVARLAARVRELEGVVGDQEALLSAGDVGERKRYMAEGARQERERLTSDSARSVVADFFDAWHFCPASRSGNSPRPLLEDAAAQLLAALATVLSEEGVTARPCGESVPGVPVTLYQDGRVVYHEPASGTTGGADGS